MTDALDRYDRALLKALQADASLTNQALAERIHLSTSQVSRRRARLEADRLIRRYRAELEPARLGLSVTVFVSVTLSTHSPDNARRFADLTRRLPQVQEAHSLTGDMDYLLKIVVKDLPALSLLIGQELLAHEAVQNVRSAIVLDTLKDDNELPLE